jgi:hypothetical protein
MKMKAKIEVMFLKLKECYRLQENHEKLGDRHGSRVCLIGLRRNQLY